MVWRTIGIAIFLSGIGTSITGIVKAIRKEIDAPLWFLASVPLYMLSIIVYVLSHAVIVLA